MAQVSIKKMKQGMAYSGKEKTIILNVFKYFKLNNPELRVTELVRRTAKATGCSEKSVFQFRKEETSGKGFKEPSKTKVRKNININSRDVKYDQNVRQSIRGIIYELKYRGILPSLNTILKQISNDERLPKFSLMTLRRLLFDMGFYYEKEGNKAILVERQGDNEGGKKKMGDEKKIGEKSIGKNNRKSLGKAYANVGESNQEEVNLNSLEKNVQNTMNVLEKQNARQNTQNSLGQTSQSSLMQNAQNLRQNQNSLEQNSQNSLEHNNQNSLDQRAQNSLRNNSRNSLLQTVQNPIVQSSQNLMEKSTPNALQQNSIGQSIQNLGQNTQTSTGQTIQNSLGHNSQNPSGHRTQNPLGQSTQTSLDQSTQNPLGQNTQISLGQNILNPLEQSNQNPLRQNSNPMALGRQILNMPMMHQNMMPAHLNVNNQNHRIMSLNVIHGDAQQIASMHPSHNIHLLSNTQREILGHPVHNMVHGNVDLSVKYEVPSWIHHHNGIIKQEDIKLAF